jgi:hypothetical protein
MIPEWDHADSIKPVTRVLHDLKSFTGRDQLKFVILRAGRFCAFPSRRFRKSHVIHAFFSRRLPKSHVFHPFFSRRHHKSHVIHAFFSRRLPKLHVFHPFFSRRHHKSHVIHAFFSRRLPKSHVILHVINHFFLSSSHNFSPREV